MNIYRRIKADPADWFSADEVRKAKDYQRPVTVVRIVNGVLSLGLLLAIIWTGAAVTVADWAGAEVWYARLPVVLFFLLLLDSLIDIPFDAWMAFAHDRKWGFSTQTPGRFVGDLLKGFVLNFVIFGILMTALWALIRTTDLWWVAGWAVFFLFSVVLAFLGPVVIMPMFNKFAPLPNEGLADRLRTLARAAELNISEVQVMDASKRTRKDNAFFTGLGKTRRVVLFDNLLEQPEASIECVVAHELGHWRRRHLARLLAVGTVLSFAVFFLVYLVSTWDAALEWAGIESVEDPASLPLVLLALVGGQLAIRYISAWHSRALERQADLESLELTGNAEGFSTMMRGLVTKNLSELAPSRLAYLRADHPPPAERLELVKRWSGQRGSVIGAT